MLEPIPIESGDRLTYEGKFKRIGRFAIPFQHSLGLYLWSLTSEVDGPQIASSSSAIGAAEPVSGDVELQRQFLALRRAGALPLQAWLERRGLGSCALPTHRELLFVYNWGVQSTPLFYQIKSLYNCTSAAPKPLVPQPKRSTGEKLKLASLLAGGLGDLRIEKMSRINLPAGKQPWIDPGDSLGRSRFSGRYTFKVV